MADFKATGISGSLTALTDGTPYLIAGSNITTTVGSNGAITIDAAGGGSSVGWTGPANEVIATTGSIHIGTTSATPTDADIYFSSDGGAIFNEQGNAAGDFRVESAGEDEAIHLDASANSLSINSGSTAFTTHINSTNGEAVTVNATGVVINEAGNEHNDFRVETSGELNALWVNAGTNSVTINGGRSSFTTTIYNTTHAAITVNDIGVVFNENSGDIDFRVESDGEDEAIHLDASANSLSINSGSTAFTTHINSANGEAVTVDANGVVINEVGSATNDFRVESNTEANAIFLDASEDTVTSAIPFIHKDQPRLSKYTTAGTWSTTTSKVNLFDDGSWSVSPTYASSLTAAYISHNTATGAFTVTHRGTYVVQVTVSAASGGASNLRLSLFGEVNSTEVYKFDNITVQTERRQYTAYFLCDVDASQAIDIYVQADSTDVEIGKAQISIHAL